MQVDKKPRDTVALVAGVVSLICVCLVVLPFFVGSIIPQNVVDLRTQAWLFPVWPVLGIVSGIVAVTRGGGGRKSRLGRRLGIFGIVASIAAMLALLGLAYLVVAILTDGRWAQ